MKKQYIGIINSSIKGAEKYYEYAQVWSDGVIHLVKDVESVTKFKSEQEAIDSLFMVSIWVCEYQDGKVKPLQPSR
ncbi:hypothetical protein E0H77_12575 [Acinetobacter sp. ANC 4633]|uniref:hypothetical protein n=1 Tax=Acinetobacter sp. ANC 4633 TaxID=2529845 RepID=UPI00103CB0FB|nr:hypothetical protein [Acinetobacter sp. ANC 4633]TCB23946.1 hypothetical protein E0H77_12575 [Acinetobacter sp. ANC 4633]